MSNSQQRHHQELITRLSRERAQAVPEDALTLSMMSGPTVLALTKPSSTANAIKDVVRLFV